VSPVLTPDLAVAYLATLWPGMRAGAVLDADGTPRAGDAETGARARALLDAAGGEAAWSAASGEPASTAAGGLLFAARSERHVVGLETGPDALRALVALDLRWVLEALESA
jgi:hypothetical protein